MSDATYEADFVLWSEHQAEALRRLRRGERANDVDWDNLIEEVESLGRSALHATTSLISRALDHLMQAAAWPNARDAGHWRGEAATFLRDAGDTFTPSMAQRIGVDRLYSRSLKVIAAIEMTDGDVPRALVATCPFTLADLLSAEFNPAAGVALLGFVPRHDDRDS